MLLQTIRKKTQNICVPFPEESPNAGLNLIPVCPERLPIKSLVLYCTLYGI